MSESKQKRQGMTPHDIMLKDLSRRLTSEGKLIEAGWIGLRAKWLHPDSPSNQVDELRMAFMAGAQHLFASIMTILDPGDEPTEADMKRIDLISSELEAFGEQLAMNLPTSGRA